MSYLWRLLLPWLVGCNALSLVGSNCVGHEGSSFCDGDVSASLKLTLTDDPVLPVPIRKRLPPPVVTTTVATTTSTSPPSTEPFSTTAEDPFIILDKLSTDYDDNFEFRHLEPTFDAAEKTAEEKERERLQRERDEYERNYCADQAGDVELTNLEHTGFSVPSNYEVFPGVGIYRFHRSPLSWEDARRRCESEGAHLLVINSQAEWDIVDGLMQRCPQLLDTHFNYYSYIGVHDMRQENHFETVLGGRLEDTGYVRWMAGQPDNAHVFGENCLSVSRRGQFNDVPCATKLPFVCEHDSF